MARSKDGSKKKRRPRARAAQAKRRTPSCDACVPAKCCLYFSTEIDEPDSLADFDDILWILAHRDVEVYTSGRSWYVMVRNPCRFHRPGRGCAIYEKRPRICRAHSTRDCEFEDAYDFDLHFRSYEELEAFVRRTFKKRP